MDVSKFKKLIERVVASEIKKQLPKILEEVSKHNTKDSLRNTRKPIVEEPEHDPFKLANAMLDQVREDDSIITEETETTPTRTEKHFTSNPVLNQLLNETAPFSQRSTPDDKMVSFDTNIAAGGLDGLKASMASKMGYGDIATNKPSGGGLGVSTGVPIVDKALNRDYSALVKAMDKKKR